MNESAIEEARITRAQAEAYIDACTEYSLPSQREKVIQSWLKKEAYAEDLVRDFRKRAGEIRGKRILELGFGSGLHIPAFARAGAEMHGLEVNGVLLDIARENMERRHIMADLRLYDGSHMPYPDAFFDSLFATSVLEHVNDARAVICEADRLLKPGGAFYLSFPNRWSPRETHTGVWFLHYLPRIVAEFLLHLFGDNTLEEINLHFLSYFSLRRLLRGTSLRVRFDTDAPTLPRRALKQLLASFGVHHSAVLKTVMVVLVKEQ